MTEAENIILQRKRAYQMACLHPEIQEMLADLAEFCQNIAVAGIPEKSAPVDIHRTMIMVGRQQVFDRIQRHLNLRTTDLYKIYTGTALVPRSGEDDNA